MFKKILIANRGEIACRVIKTARRMGIATVAVYSEADRTRCSSSWPTRRCDRRGGQPRVLPLDRQDHRRLQQTGAEAVHPGYGFLSENEEFARRVEEEGIVFIGPKHASIAAMGDKIARSGWPPRPRSPPSPGTRGDRGRRAAAEIAKRIGYPVMIKASAGGGGKGLRVAYDDAQAKEGFASCRNEAKAAFGDDRVFIEKFVEQPRHIEIQVLGDAHGNCVYLWERECSIQRRHQKVVEEAPSPFLDDATRKAMGEQAVALARAVNYQSAGTVEFVVGKDKSFFFLEMNTRLQVEHPVTESITGLDLVEQMIRVAAGERLTFTQAEIPRRGWAIECRINAEDPQRGFLPSTGRLVVFRPPPQTLVAGEPRLGATGVRVDTGVYEGGEIPIHYDSMICKLIAVGVDRGAAIAAMQEALGGFTVRGVASNIAFQSALLAHPRFAAGDFDTGFIAQEFAGGFDPGKTPHPDPDFLLALAVAVNRRLITRSAGITGQLPGHGLKIGDAFVAVQTDATGKRTVTPATVQVSGDVYLVTIGDRPRRISIASALRDIATVGLVDGKPFQAQVERFGLAYRVSHGGAQADVRVLSPRAAELQALMPFKPPPDLSRFLLSPMPGLLVDVAVAPGQAVRAGERLAVIEAMKMENILVATNAGVVARVVAAKGASLAVDDVILEFESAGESK